MSEQTSQIGIGLKDLCQRFAVNYDEARYILARGILPKTVAEADPGRGNHRLFDHSQALYLAVVLKLKAAGITSSVAGKILEWTRHEQFMSVNPGQDWRFAALSGQYSAKNQWYIDVGDAQYARSVTDANPSSPGTWDATPWFDITNRKVCRSARPVVIFRVDVALIAQQLVRQKVTKKAPSRRRDRISRR